MQGFILINKPKGLSSFRVVSKVRGIIRENTGQKLKVGHSGTLDPQATGLLLLAIGSYTKKLSELIKKDKTYEVIICLGKISTTGDAEGAIIDKSNKEPTLNEIKTALSYFEGELMQTPPVFSAIKINGQRAYNLARKGKKVDIPARKIVIYKNKLTDYNYPFIKFISNVSSGTYIRTLAQDIGEYLKTSAYMSDLKRTKIDNYRLDDAVDLNDLTYSKINQSLLTLEK